ncbi:MAG: MFS transporter, partial [archaeon]|nr:MFS transporter [archaeon]
MLFHIPSPYRLIRRDVDKLFLAVAIRNFGMGMIALFAPIYVFSYFGESLPLVFMYYALMYGLYGFLAVMTGKLIDGIGITKSILISFVLYFLYYLALFFFPVSAIFVPLAIIFGAVGMLMLWPAFHTAFIRYSSRDGRGSDVGRGRAIRLLPTIVSPLIGGWILFVFGYPTLFMVVFALILAGLIPLFYARGITENYTDTMEKAWRRISDEHNRRRTVALASHGMEIIVLVLIWPLFLFGLGINFSEIGGIASFALLVSTIFLLYVGSVSNNEKDRIWLLRVGSFWTALSWIFKIFVHTPFDAFLAHTIYRISKSSADIPFQTSFYEIAAHRDGHADEFIVYRETVV